MKSHKDDTTLIKNFVNSMNTTMMLSYYITMILSGFKIRPFWKQCV